MPTSALIDVAGLLPLRAFASLGSDCSQPNFHIITPMSWCAVGEDLGSLQAGATGASAAYTAASRAFAVPFSIARPFLVRKVFWLNGTTATTDSADVGVYTEAGARLVSGGGTAISGASATQEVDVTDTLLKPGRYFMAYTQNGTTATVVSHALTSANARAMGIFQQTASAYPLPNPFVSAVLGSIQLPVFGIASRTLAS